MIMRFISAYKSHINFIKQWNHVRSIHHSSVFYRRHARHGATSDVGLEELIIDKSPSSYPNLRQKLNRINYYNHFLNPVNLGFQQDSQQYQYFLNQSVNILNESNDTVEIEIDELLLDPNKISKNNSLSSEEYMKLSQYYKFTQHYLDSTISLAHHYGVFRDLFPQQDSPINFRNVIVANGKNEKNILNSKSFYFSPLVSIEADFSNQLDSQDQEVATLKSFQGNLIPSEYGAEPPKILINSSAIYEKFEIVNSTDQFDVNLIAGKKSDPMYYTLAMVNLDSHFNDLGVCHWMLTNIHRHDNNDQTKYETLIKYLPVYAIRGLGYHRYVLVLFQHNQPLIGLNKIEDFDLFKRRFDGFKFLADCQKSESSLSIKPIGLTWFQTTWSDYCRDVFYKYLDMRCPTYEYQFPKQIAQFEQLQFPGRAPFNLYLDAFRNPKELAKEVLLERLKELNPFESYDTKKMFPTWEGEPRLTRIHPYPENTPDWLKSTIMKRRAHLGRFRGLRAHSAILPHNNNADLDKPKWPRISPDVLPLNVPNPYPDGKRRPKPLRETLWAKPVTEHHSLRVAYADNLEKKDKESFEKTPDSN